VRRHFPLTEYRTGREQYLRLAADKGYLTATVLRPGNAYGTALSEFRMQGLIGVAVNSVVHGKPVRVFGNPNNVRDYVHLDDIQRYCHARIRSTAALQHFQCGQAAWAIPCST